MTARPPASMMRVFGPARAAISPDLPTAVIFSPVTATASAMLFDASTVATFALVTIRSVMFFSRSSLRRRRIM